MLFASEAHLEAERRQVTVLFADMVGFTTLLRTLGRGSRLTLMRSLSKLMDEAVREQGGVVQSFTGDGIMAVFGAPVAFEDAPLRACRAALSILQRLKEAGPDLEAKHGVRPQLRIGLNTGAAVVGKVEEGADAGVTVLGDTVNFAARLQSAGRAGFGFHERGDASAGAGNGRGELRGRTLIKGKSEPQKVYRLDGIRHGATRFDAAVSRGLSAFVGREHELEVLERGLDEAAPNSASSISRPNRAWASRGSCTSSASASARIAPLSCQEAARPMASRRHSSPSSRWCAARFGSAPAKREGDVAQKLEMGLTSLGLALAAAKPRSLAAPAWP